MRRLEATLLHGRVAIAVKNWRSTGTVPGETQRLEAAVVARSTVGVCSVQDDLRIAD
jgi:osmotically-inducible protein OsmY